MTTSRFALTRDRASIIARHVTDVAVIAQRLDALAFPPRLELVGRVEGGAAALSAARGPEDVLFGL